MARRWAEGRREEIVEIAIEHFAAGGFHGTSSKVIAKEAGISQPYLFRLFRTKRELFLACSDRACEKVLDAFRRAAADAPAGEELHAMGRAYVEELLPDRHAILTMMQGYVAVSDADIQEHVRRRYGEVVNEVAELADAEPEQVWTFFANGMLLNIVAALGLADSDHPVFRAWTALRG